MNVQEKKIEEFIDELQAEYDGVDLYLDEIEESLTILNKCIVSNQRLNEALKKDNRKNKFTKTPGRVKRAIRKKVKAAVRKVRGDITFRSSVKSNDNNNGTVCVIVPTCKPNEHIYKTIESVLNQKNAPNIEIVVSVNGNVKAWYEALEKKYQRQENLRVAYTPIEGFSAAGNNGIKNTNAEFVFFLNDNEIITDRLISELKGAMNSTTAVSLAPYYDSNSGLDNNNNRAIRKLISKKTRKITPSQIVPLATVTGKLFRRAFFLDYLPFNEKLEVDEDIIFWADNYDNLCGNAVCVSPEKKQYYEKLVEGDALSRNMDKLKYIEDRVGVIGELEKRLFNEGCSWSAKKAILKLITAQQGLMKKQYDLCSDKEKETAEKTINEYPGFYINKGNYSNQQAIAFCHNFSPYIDASSMVSTRRLKQINCIENTNLRWTVVCKNMSDVREIDDIYEDFFAKQIYSEKINIGGKTSISTKQQIEFALRAYRRVKNLEAKVIYSRAMYPASHIAAYLYKKEHPETIWYAEFSDPLRKDTGNNWRQRQDATKPAYYNNFWEICEIMPYQYADVIIFTNENQRDYMCSYNEKHDEILKKSVVLTHPPIESKFTKLKKSRYSLDNNVINIGYFGTFYRNRTIEEIKPLAMNGNVKLHVFTRGATQADSLDETNICVNSSLPYFEFLNLASRMDYVVLNDMKSTFGTVPWLPSKYSDYISSGTKVIAKCIEGSPLSKMKNDNLIKVAAFDESFVSSLSKQK